MQNQLYAQPQYYIPQQMQTQNFAQPQYYAPQQPVSSYPTSSVGAVNIQIFNPTANPAPGFYQQQSCGCYPCNYNNLIQTPQIQQNVQSNPPQAPVNSNANLHEQAQQPQITPDMSLQSSLPSSSTQLNLNNSPSGIASQADGENNKTEDKKDKKPKKPTITLTDDYIKTLENYLNSQDKKIRLLGAKELLDRFKEDETRKDDPALTALLNKIIQDPSETVKFVGLTVLDSDYANGNDETAQILSQMQNSNSSYGEDALLASKVLLKMSGKRSMKNLPQNAQLVNTKDYNLNKIPNPEGGVLLANNTSGALAQNSTVAQNGNI